VALVIVGTLYEIVDCPLNAVSVPVMVPAATGYGFTVTVDPAVKFVPVIEIVCPLPEHALVGEILVTVGAEQGVV
jgi:hypothetical protein